MVVVVFLLASWSEHASFFFTATVRSWGFRRQRPSGSPSSPAGRPVEEERWPRELLPRAAGAGAADASGVTAVVWPLPCAAEEESSCLPFHGKKKASGPLTPPSFETKRRRRAVCLDTLSLHTGRPGLCVDRRHNEDFRNREKCKRML